MELAARLEDALVRDVPDALSPGRPADRADRFRTLLLIYDLHTAPLVRLDGRVRWQNHPTVAELKWRLEQEWLNELERLEPAANCRDADSCVTALRALAARDRLPAPYEWLAREATWPQAVRFLALEGGPDGGFDDLVAACQTGLSGLPKLTLAQNYWDEMGNGALDRVHTTLHDRLVAAIDMPRVPLRDQPEPALERAALGGLLATNHWLQPEMIGALGLIELQAGPRCRLVLRAFDRLGVPADAYPFYEEHAEVDPRHGKDWLESAIVPLVEENPDWAPRIVRGAQWRSYVNAAFFHDLHARLAEEDPAAA